MPITGIRQFILGLAALLLASALLPVVTLCAQPVIKGVKLVEPSLVFDSTAAVPGETVQVGLLLRMAPGYHTYWQYAGDSGEAIRVTWKLPPGVTAGPLKWPVPQRYVDRARNETYIYPEEVLLTTTLTLPAEMKEGTLEIGASAGWLVCEDSCYDGAAELTASLPIKPSLDGSKPANEKLFMYWEQRQPTLTALSAMPLEDFVWSREGKEFTVKLTGLRLPEGTKLDFYPTPPPELVLDHPVAVASLSGTEASITVPFFQVAEEVKELTGVLVADLPADKVAKGWPARQAWVLTKLPTSDFGDNADPASIADKLAAHTGYPGGGTTTGADAQAGEGATDSAGSTPPVAKAAVADAAPTLVYVLWLAFLGGLVLNVMPCVLPAISLKIMGFIQDAHEEPRKIALMGVAFAAGVFTFFMGFATLSVVLTASGQSLGWGQQFQYPGFVIGMSVFMLLFALNLFGLFEINLPGTVLAGASNAAAKTGFSGAYLHGLLATLLATACTAPFMAFALGATLGQPPYYTFAVLAMLALGMSAPYLLLALRPGWLKFLPRPGPWMESMKQFMGFLLLVTVIWLLWVFAGIAAEDAVFWLILSLVALSAGVWFLGVAKPAARTVGGKRFATVMAAAMVLVALGVVWQRGLLEEPTGPAPSNIAAAGGIDPDVSPLTKSGEIAWHPWSAEAVQAGLDAGRVVYIDFTARWCTNCQANKKLVLDTPPIVAEFGKRNVLALKADYTRRDAVTKAAIESYGRTGIPLNVIYGPGQPNGEPALLPEILTQENVMEALKRANGAPDVAAAM